MTTDTLAIAVASLVHRISEEWYPAWDSGDAERLERVTREIFSSAATVVLRPGAPAASIDDLVPSWLGELDTWRPQLHEIVEQVESRRDAAWVTRWRGTHAAAITLSDGRVFPPSGAELTGDIAFFASWDGERITSLKAFSDSSALLAQLEAHVRA